MTTSDKHRPGTKVVFASVPEEIHSALHATSKRLGRPAVRIVEQALRSELLRLSTSDDREAADERYEREVLRLSQSAQELIDGVKRIEGGR